jgi:uncharacterized membrane protein HdeD (DUF308 family)
MADCLGRAFFSVELSQRFEAKIMSNETQIVSPVTVEQVVKHELQHVRSQWCWFLFLGILLLVSGVMALTFPFVAATAAMSVLSIVLLVAGVATIIGSFWTGKWSGFLVQLLMGMLYVAAGFVVSERPLVSILLVTIYVAVSFMVMGVFRILAALTIRFPQWGWTLLNGAVTFLVGLSIYRHLPLSLVWVVGFLVGVELLFSGLNWIMLSMEIRKIPK